MRLFLLLLIVPVILFTGCGGGGAGGNGPGPSSGTMTVFAFNDLGMHCMNQDFSEMMILPPFNNLHAQVIARSGENPQIITSGVTVQYTIPGNTTSANKTNFWQYANALFGVTLQSNIGLTGNGLSGTMTPVSGSNIWEASGIPVTPLDDNMQLDPYPLATVTVTQNGQMIAETQNVVPVSWEISCNLCHNTSGISTAMDILQAHDRLHSTSLATGPKPVACGSCHRQAPLAAIFPGNPSLHTLSSAMHTSHAPRMAQAGLTNECYACHPGTQTQCLRDVHKSNGLDCKSCHTSMTAVGNPSRQPWVDEPRCGTCHPLNAQHAAYQFEQPNTLYRNSKGHHGVYCASCHGSPHAITPSTLSQDNIQAIDKQGHAGPIDTCTVCHTSHPDDAFDHSFSGGGG